jgi:drug/metabolite transporter (DMT)-like permease
MTGDRLTLTQILLLLGYAAGMTGGQFLFKLAATRSPTGSVTERLLGLSHDLVFLCAIALYGALAFAWVWILTFTPLSRAYPFVAVAFAITPLLGAILFGEPVSLRLFAGIVVVFLGLLIVVG